MVVLGQSPRRADFSGILMYLYQVKDPKIMVFRNSMSEFLVKVRGARTIQESRVG
jgi:hypothetical protein